MTKLRVKPQFEQADAYLDFYLMPAMDGGVVLRAVHSVTQADHFIYGITGRGRQILAEDMPKVDGLDTNERGMPIRLTPNNARD